MAGSEHSGRAMAWTGWWRVASRRLRPARSRPPHLQTMPTTEDPGAAQQRATNDPREHLGEPDNKEVEQQRHVIVGAAKRGEHIQRADLEAVAGVCGEPTAWFIVAELFSELPELVPPEVATEVLAAIDMSREGPLCPQFTCYLFRPLIQKLRTRRYRAAEVELAERLPWWDEGVAATWETLLPVVPEKQAHLVQALAEHPPCGLVQPPTRDETVALFANGFPAYTLESALHPWSIVQPLDYARALHVDRAMAAQLHAMAAQLHANHVTHEHLDELVVEKRDRPEVFARRLAEEEAKRRQIVVLRDKLGLRPIKHMRDWLYTAEVAQGLGISARQVRTAGDVGHIAFILKQHGEPYEADRYMYTPYRRYGLSYIAQIYDEPPEWLKVIRGA